jgi:hypothetical protein
MMLQTTNSAETYEIDPDFRQRCALAMWLLLALFVLRVVGQMLVAFLGVSFLPPMDEWYSGLMSYPILLPVQWVIVVMLSAICIDVSRGRGIFAQPNRRAGMFLKWFSVVYFASMIARYAITMTAHPERRWLHDTIPIWFHMVLASYLFVLSRYHSAGSQFMGEERQTAASRRRRIMPS